MEKMMPYVCSVAFFTPQWAMLRSRGKSANCGYPASVTVVTCCHYGDESAIPTRCTCPLYKRTKNMMHNHLVVYV